MPSKTRSARPQAAPSPSARQRTRRAPATAADASAPDVTPELTPDAAPAAAAPADVPAAKPRGKARAAATTPPPAARKTRSPRVRAAVAQAAEAPAAVADEVPAPAPATVAEAQGAADAAERPTRRGGRSRRAAPPVSGSAAQSAAQSTAQSAAQSAVDAPAPAMVEPPAEPDVAPDGKPAAEAPESTAAPVAERAPSRRSRGRRSEGGDRGDRAERGDRAARDAAVPAAPIPPVPPAAPRGPVAEIESPADGALFGRYAVRVPGEEAAEVWLRSPHPGTAVCTCLDFALSEHADCPHVQALWSHLQADADRAAAFARGPQAVGSRIAVLHGARRRLLWLPGTECTASLNDLAEQLLGVPPDELDDQAVPRLLRAAREAGHELQVDEAAWAHLAAARDARWRVHRLETLFPQGPASADLQVLGTTAAAPLLPLQVEGALFAVCAGRCILGDAPELQPMQQALAAAC
jgi:hypothetical protein